MATIRILLAEDNKNIIKLIKMYLEKEGFDVFVAENGDDALDMFYDKTIDLAILDISMPKLSGFEVMKDIRTTSDIPIIIVTAKREEVDRIRGFKLGADDYVIKPFSPFELVMRVRALLKRSGKLSQNFTIELKNMTINTVKKTVIVSGESIKLSSREFDLLVYFIDNHSIVLTRNQIFERLWGYDTDVDTRALDTTIKRLRHKLGEYGECIKTVRGMGYIFEEQHK